MSDEDRISAADEQALRAMFAALVEDAEPSGLSPLEVQRSAKAAQGATLDRRVKRLKFVRNALVAAVLAGVVALLVPHLGSKSSSTAAGSVSSAAAAAASAPAGFAPAQTAAGAGAVAPAPAAGGGGKVPASGSVAAGTSASSSSSAAAASSAASAPSSAPMAASARPSAVSSAAASGAASSGSSGGADSGCISVPEQAAADVRAALPGYRGSVRITGCAAESVEGAGPGTVTFVVGPAVSAKCPTATAGGCRPVAGASDAYVSGNAVTVVGSAGGAAVTVTSTAGGPARPALIAAARALLKTLG